MKIVIDLFRSRSILFKSMHFKPYHHLIDKILVLYGYHFLCLINLFTSGNNIK